MADFPKKTQVSEADPGDIFQSGNGPISIEPKSGPIESLKPADPVASFTLNRTVRTGVEDQLHVALDNMPGALVYTDEDLNIVVCNDRFKEMYRVPVELLQPGRPYPDFLRFLAENGYTARVTSAFSWLSGLRACAIPRDIVFEDQTPDGRWYRILRRRTSAWRCRHGDDGYHRGEAGSREFWRPRKRSYILRSTTCRAHSSTRMRNSEYRHLQ